MRVDDMIPKTSALCALICVLVYAGGSIGGEADYISAFPSPQQYLRRNTPRSEVARQWIEGEKTRMLIIPRTQPR